MKAADKKLPHLNQLFMQRQFYNSHKRRMF